VKFWDSSALVPLFLPESTSGIATRWLESDPHVAVWALTRVEILSAIARKRREQPEAKRALEIARDSLSEAAAFWTEIADLDRVRKDAERLVELYPLRAADALQLEATLVAAEGKPESLEFIIFDRRLAHAATGERFRVPAGE
jgi:predicted nucleic acid-binding protein